LCCRTAAERLLQPLPATSLPDESLGEHLQVFPYLVIEFIVMLVTCQQTAQFGAESA
jgi:hypothetical protein